MGSTARQTHEQQVATLRKDTTLAELVAAGAAGVRVGVLPAGARVLRTILFIETAFNAATTNVFDIGFSGTPSGLMASATAVAGTTGQKSTSPSALAGVIAADTQINAIYSQTGTAATTGVASMIVEYVAQNEG